MGRTDPENTYLTNMYFKTIYRLKIFAKKYVSLKVLLGKWGILKYLPILVLLRCQYQNGFRSMKDIKTLKITILILEKSN